MIHTIYSNYYEILQEFLLQNIGHERKDVFATHRELELAFLKLRCLDKKK